MMWSARRSGEQGFVLPSVLAYITIAMLLILVGAQALERARDASLALRSDRILINALDDLEAEATYRYLVSAPVRYGISRTQGPQDVMAILLGTSEAEQKQEDVPQGADALWRADGGTIGFERPGIVGTVEYRDVGGLVSLNSADPALIAGLLEMFGVSSDDAVGLAARLRDYTDEDVLRRPRGAERADYRLRQRPIPTDSPLRSVAEVSRVMGWEDLDFLANPAFLEHVTASLTNPTPRWVFASPSVLKLREKVPQTVTTNLDPLMLASESSVVPAGRARFLIRASDTQTGRSRLRIVEIERTPAAAAMPWTRALVLDTPLPEDTRPVSLEGVEKVNFLQGTTDE